MSRQITWTVTAPGVNKAQAALLAVEFWTSQGFAEHTSSYNKLVLRKNGYGKVSALLNSLVATAGGWDKAPVELVILIQTMPDHVRYNLQFSLGIGWFEDDAGDLDRFTNGLVNGFISFNNEWTKHAQRAME